MGAREEQERPSERAHLLLLQWLSARTAHHPLARPRSSLSSSDMTVAHVSTSCHTNIGLDRPPGSLSRPTTPTASPHNKASLGRR